MILAPIARRYFSTGVPLQATLSLVGGSGFVGREVIRQVGAGQEFDTVRVVGRSEKSAARALSVAKESGVKNVEFREGNVTNLQSLQSALEGSDAVVNLVGLLYETADQTFLDVQERGPGLVAAACVHADVKRAVHVSAIGASGEAKAKYLFTKGWGEDAFLAKFPTGTVLRPSLVFGPEDNGLNMFHKLLSMFPVFPLIGGGATKFQPVHVGDVAKAIISAATSDATSGKTFELGGSEVYSMKDLVEYVCKKSGKSRATIPIPFFIGELQGGLMQFMPTPLVTRDQVLCLQVDNVASAGSLGFKDLGISPAKLEDVVTSYPWATR